MWICSRCRTNVGREFDVCWRCGTSYQGEEDPDFVIADESPPIEDPTDYLRLDTGKLEETELPEPPIELAPCFESNDITEAHFVADHLTGDGVPATLQNSFNVGLPRDTYSNYPCTVVVRAEDLPRAQLWVKAYRARSHARER